MPAADRSLFINLISDRPANIAKAVRLGRKFLAAGWPVVLYLNVDAVVAANPAADLAPCPVSGELLSDQVRAFQAEGGRVLVGQECLNVAGLALEQLLPAVEMATFPVTERLIGAAGARVITF